MRGSFKSFYDVSLRANYPITIDNKIIEPEETIVRFNEINIGGLRENIKEISATGGYGNRGLVSWVENKSMNLTFSQGVFSPNQLAVLLNSKLISYNDNNLLLINKSENKESDENGRVVLKEKPFNHIFIYEKESGKKIKQYDINNKILTITEPYKDLVIDYNFAYRNDFKNVSIGKELLKGYLHLEGKTLFKDDQTGKSYTILIKIPKIKILSSLNIAIGNSANPVSMTFYGECLPDGNKDNNRLCDFYFLNNDIDADL